MRLTIILVTALIIISSVAAETEKWMYPGEPFTFEGEIYYAFTDNDRDSAILQSNNTKLILDIGECENKNLVRYCFVEVAGRDDYDHIKFDTDRNALYGMKLSFESLGPKIQASQKHSKTAPDLNDRIEGEITVKNTGNQRANTIVVTWQANDSISIRSCSDCERTRRTFTRRFANLDAGSTINVPFAFIVDESRPFSSEANVTYEYEGETGTAGPLKQSFSIKKPYSVSHSKPGKVRIGEWIDLSLTVKNTGENTISISTERIGNASLTYENAPFNDLRSLESFTLEPEESKTYAYRALSTIAGTYGTGFDVRIERSEDSYEEKIRHDLIWTLEDLALGAHISKRSPASGDTSTLTVTVKNRGSLAFENLVIRYDGEISDETSIAVINTDTSLKPFEKRFTHPKTDTRLERTFNVTLRYDTRFGEEQTSERTIPYTVIPISESYELRRAIKPKEPEIGEAFTITVYGLKTVDSAVKYSHVEDRLIGARIERGNHRHIPIESQKEELLYQYEAIRNDERFAIITSVDATFLDQEAHIRDVYSTFNLSEEAIEEAIEKQPAGTIETEDVATETPQEPETDEESSAIEPEEPSVPEQEGFFSRIMNWFRNLFG
jgi:hypothetical protein